MPVVSVYGGYFLADDSFTRDMGSSVEGDSPVAGRQKLPSRMVCCSVHIQYFGCFADNIYLWLQP